MPNPSPADDERVRAHRLHMTARSRPFALYWFATSVIWVALLVVQAHLGLVHGALVLAGELAVLATVVRLVGQAPDGRRVPVVLLIGSVLLGMSVTVLYATMHSDGAFLAFILLTLYLACAIFFSWGWVLELIVLGGTVIVWLLAVPFLEFPVPAPQLAAAIVIGSAFSLTISEARARGFDREFTHRVREAESRQALRVALDSQREVAERERVARLEAERAMRAKDEFLAMLGHELRNPLAAVRNAVIAAGLDESRRPRALEIARRQADQLGRLIDDLLDVARITRGQITLRKERVDLTEIIERAVESTRSAIESRGLSLAVSLAPSPISVEADPARLEQVFVNLLSNAAKYTEAGGRIDVVTQRRGEEVTIRVRDTGIGIAPEMLSGMWDLFAQADQALDRAQGGLGIGLTVARQLVDLHGGRIEARSEGVGMGAEFVVTLRALPMTGEEVRPKTALEPGPHRAARVLLVEDNPDAAEALTMLVELLGHHVHVVHDGVAALDAARASAPDVMLVDIGLPGMDGYEVARRVRQSDFKDVLLVAVTGYGRDEDKQRASTAGFDYHLTKPVDHDALHRILAHRGRPDRVTRNYAALESGSS